MKRSLGALLLTVAFGLSALTSVSMAAVGDDNYDNTFTMINVEPSDYPGDFPNQVPTDWYAPGDPIPVTLENFVDVPDTFEDLFDVVVFPDGWSVFGDNVFCQGEYALDANGDGSMEIPGTTTGALSDGQYEVWVADMNYCENTGGAMYDMDTFEIHWFWVIASYDRLAYIPGDEVTVFYSARLIKDGSLALEDGVTWDEREWAVESTDGKTVRSGQLTDPSGSFSFTIISSGGTTPGTDYPVYIWFNGTDAGVGALREFAWPDDHPNPPNDIEVRGLRVRIGGLGSFPLGAVVEARVDVTVDGIAPEEGVEVLIEVFEGTGTTKTKLSGYGGTFDTDSNGQVKYLFKLDSNDFSEDKTYTVTANGTKSLKSGEDTETFNVVKGARVISVDLVFDEGAYASGGTVNVEARWSVPAGASSPNTFVYTVWSNAQTFVQQVSSESTFTFDIPSTFVGTLYFEVEVYNPDGDFGRDQDSREVTAGIMLVNSDDDNYNPGETITVQYELVNSVLSSPSIFYRVMDNGGAIVAEDEIAGGGLTGSFTFDVPDVPSSSYTFVVMANQAGTTVSGSDVSFMVGGFLMRISFDKAVYSPGETMTVKYTIVARGTSVLPASFTLAYGLTGEAAETTSTTESSGTVTYKVPADTNEGNVFFSMGDGVTGAYASEMIVVKASPNPLWWAQLADIPLFDIILLILIVILFILLFRRGGAGAPMGEPMAPPEPTPPPQEPVSGAMMTVSCKSCGAPIDIATSKRPIEVMCPSCGETEMVA